MPATLSGKVGADKSTKVQMPCGCRTKKKNRRHHIKTCRQAACVSAWQQEVADAEALQSERKAERQRSNTPSRALTASRNWRY